MAEGSIAGVNEITSGEKNRDEDFSTKPKKANSENYKKNIARKKKKAKRQNRKKRR